MSVSASAFVHETALVENGATIGEGSRIWHQAQVRTRAVRRVLKTIEMVDPATAQAILGLEPDEAAPPPETAKQAERAAEPLALE